MKKIKSLLITLLCTSIFSLISCASSNIAQTQEEYDTLYPTVKFGSFPQSEKSEEVVINENESVSVNAFTCYKGNDEKLYVKHNDKYYKLEEIEWIVLSDKFNKGKLLIAKKGLTALPFYSSKEDRNIEDKVIKAINYEYSNLRAYLNSLDGSSYNVPNYKGKGFIDLAFTEEEKEKIIEITVDNSAKQSNDETQNIGDVTSYVCDNTSDKVFILSEKEVTTPSFGFDKYNKSIKRNDDKAFSSRVRIPTEYAKANGAKTDDYYKNNGFWWLRSPSLDPTPLAAFDSNNKTLPSPYFIHRVCANGYAYLSDEVTVEHNMIVPAIVIRKD